MSGINIEIDYALYSKVYREDLNRNLKRKRQILTTINTRHSDYSSTSTACQSIKSRSDEQQ